MSFLTHKGSEKRRVCRDCGKNRRLWFFDEDVNGFSKNCKVCTDPTFVHPKENRVFVHKKKSSVFSRKRKENKRRYCTECKSYRRAYMFSKNEEYCGKCTGTAFVIPVRKNRKGVVQSMVERTAARRSSKKKLLNKYWKFLRAWSAFHPCPGIDDIKCGETDFVVLDFDHVRGKKLGGISEIVAGKVKVPEGLTRFQFLLQELLKCEVKCANCHRRKTAKDQNWYVTE